MDRVLFKRWDLPSIKRFLVKRGVITDREWDKAIAGYVQFRGFRLDNSNRVRFEYGLDGSSVGYPLAMIQTMLRARGMYRWGNETIKH